MPATKTTAVDRTVPTQKRQRRRRKLHIELSSSSSSSSSSPVSQVSTPSHTVDTDDKFVEEIPAKRTKHKRSKKPARRIKTQQTTAKPPPPPPVLWSRERLARPCVVPRLLRPQQPVVAIEPLHVAIPARFGGGTQHQPRVYRQFVVSLASGGDDEGHVATSADVEGEDDDDDVDIQLEPATAPSTTHLSDDDNEEEEDDGKPPSLQEH